MPTVGGLNPTNTLVHHLHLPPAPHQPLPDLHCVAADKLCLGLCCRGNNVASPKWEAVAKALVAKGYNSHPGV